MLLFIEWEKIGISGLSRASLAKVSHTSFSVFMLWWDRTWWKVMLVWILWISSTICMIVEWLVSLSIFRGLVCRCFSAVEIPLIAMFESV